MNKITLTGLVLALAAAGASAQTALSQLGVAAGGDTAPLARELQSARALDQVPSNAPVVALPRQGKDVLASCDVLTAKSFMPWNVSQAAIMVQTCLNHAYKADGDYRVTAAPARFGSRLCPNGQGASCRAIVEVVGIKITVSGQVLTGDSVLLDLNASLAQRHNKLLGFETTVDNQAAILK
jgi:hypothetical protein